MTSNTSADFELSELQKKQIQRWPYRQVSSKLIKIQHLCKFMAHVSDPEQKARIQQKIKQLTTEYLELVGGQVPSELQISHADVPTLPAPSYKGDQPLDPAVIAAASDDDATPMDEDEDMEDASEAPQRLSAYSLRFILSDCTVLETDTGLQYTTTT
ncbi:hypothetical protein BBO99_00000014 [Phytophthora kernoviae]|uniref:Uncharacterized protein n=2 Tax=Phytophthora kernoviae TaxID=325452 RepID=A0A3R7HPD8_9STRA|nr:hypothetical protein G195_003410 [Phytophthora kernoviae 00238/432]KAG2533042.1 hypothetical protein JM16_000220 [Phytophthora kernoviae]KAG2533335.1 hypothetical protein JM18_000133 [Phytophthora kernoviae]RLN26828.1 hypothetical protein BBI17_000014 [Phytophthora kernoviae]RLN86014.1 hypothetical protein BBO99_00000014 [Phytophthora kernoviae]